MADELEVYVEGNVEEEPDETHGRKSKLEYYCVYCASVILPLSLVLLALSNIYPDAVSVNYGLAGLAVSVLLILVGYVPIIARSIIIGHGSIWPFGFNRRTAHGVQHVGVRRRSRTRSRQGPNIDTGRASASSRTPLLNPALNPSSSDVPTVTIHFPSGYSSRNLPGQKRTGSESSLSEERSLLLVPVPSESASTSRISDVASIMSEFASKSVPRREGMLTRSLSRQGHDAGVEVVSPSSAARQTDPAVPGPSGLQSAELPVRHLRSSSKKTDSDSQYSKRQSVLRSPPVSGRSTRKVPESASSVSDAASGGVRRRREKFAAQKAHTQEQLGSGKSSTSGSERRCSSSMM